MFTELVNLLEQNSILFTSLITLFGLFVGSFLNVVIYRLPRRLQHEWRSECKEFLGANASSTDNAEAPPENIFTSRSHCPHCSHLISALENIPLLSYLVLRGKCSECNAHISVRYPVVEILTAVLSGISAWTFGFSAALPFVLILLWSLIALSFIDFDHKLLPDKLVYPVLWLGLLVNSQNILTDIYSAPCAVDSLPGI